MMMDELEKQAAEQTADEACACEQHTTELSECEKHAQELAACEDKYLRLRAEYDNFRKRSQKERESVFSMALAEAVGAFVPVLDNLERACQAPSADDGVRMIMKQLCEVFDKMDVRAVGEKGDGFDPKLHDAVVHDGVGGEHSIISEVLQKGYVLGDKLIRPAMVKTTDAEQ